MRDSLWFFTAGRIRNAPVGRNTVTPLNIPYTFEDKSQRYEGKMTYSLSANHRFDGTYTKVNQTEANGTFSTATSMDLRSLYTRELPQNLFTVGYSGVITPSLFIEGRYSARHFSFIGSGATSTDLIDGTLLIDSARGNLRYWSPTFCGVCDPEKRDNEEVFVKGTYVLSSRGSGSHTLLFGYDTFNDQRFANNHQSGSDYRILGTSTIIRGSDIYPRWLPGSTTIQWNPIATGTEGTNFRTNAIFLNDTWRWTDRVTVNLGLRWDKNQGKDSAGRTVADDSAFSPRLGVVWDPAGNGLWAISGSFSKYVAGLNNSIADSSSAAGNPATIQFAYNGPAINPDIAAASLVTPDVALQQLFAWFNANGGTSMTPTSSSVPGVSVQIPNSLTSPNVRAYAGGLSRQLGGRAVVRADYSYRDYRDFYSSRIDRSTGIVTDQFGNRADLAILENTNDLKRRYSGVTISGRYRINSRSDAGGSYTLSRLWGNFDGENSASGPLTSDLFQYPEYREARWFSPEGDLAADQRHRAILWLNYGVPKIEGLTISVLQDLATGLPYGAGGGLAQWPVGLLGKRDRRCAPLRHGSGLRDATGRRSRDLLLHGARCIPHRRLPPYRHGGELHLSRSRQPVARSVRAGAVPQRLQRAGHVRVRQRRLQQRRRRGSQPHRQRRADARQLAGAGGVQPVHDDARAGRELELQHQLRHTAQPFCVHVTADVPHDVRAAVLR